MRAALYLPILVGGAAACLVPTAGSAQAPTERITRVTVYGTERCPTAGSAGEIVICARRPDNERYRIPKEIRDREATDDPASTSWAERAQSLEYVGRTGIQSCSTVGPGGFTGCWADLVRTARGERAKASAEPGR
ncbi:MAG: hypothetical protein JO013_13260 [Alphaproteobacteria bacterium]|nr:hypothetical protein [Alphaproteobacteria bacterium]